MANNAAKLGLPSITINFQSMAATAMIRSSQGIVAMVLNDESLTDDDGVLYYKVTETGDIPKSISDTNTDLVQKALAGSPAQIDLYLIPNAEYEVESEVAVSETVATEVTIESEVSIFIDDDFDDPDFEPHSETVISNVTVESTTIITSTETQLVTAPAEVDIGAALKEIGNTQCNWICYPTGGVKGQSELASWVKGQRANNNKRFKAVVAHVAADNEGVVNFTTENIKVTNPAYTDALSAVNGDSDLVDETIPQYVIYSATQYTSRIAGLLAGMSLDRSPTYYQLPEIVSCQRYDDISQHIDNGELCLFDAHDNNGVKIARGCNSLTTFTATHGEDFRFIKIVKALDMIGDDISRTFAEEYVGKVINSYENKALFISAILVYFGQLKSAGVLDNSPTAENYVEVDLEAHENWAKVHGVDITDYTEQQLREINTGTHVFLSGKIRVVNAMEDLNIDFVL